MKIQGMIIIIFMCGFLLLLMAVKTRSAFLLNIIFRGLTGSVLIIIGNYIFQILEISVQIGLNPLTFLTCSFLGFPGVALIFAVSFFLIL